MTDIQNPDSNQPEFKEPSVAAAIKKRGGCLTAFLIMMFIANPIGALFYLFGDSVVQETFPNATTGVVIVFFLLSVFNLICL